jgi:hypothetical protein
MKKSFFVLTSVAVATILIVLGLKALSPQLSKTRNETILTPTPAERMSKKAIEKFLGEKEQGLVFETKYADPKQAEEVVDIYDDKNGAHYEVEVSTNQIVTYFYNRGSSSQPSQSTITFQQAEQQAQNLAKKNIPNFTVVMKGAKYNSVNETETGIYDFNWLWEKPLTQTQKEYYAKKGIKPPLYQTVIVIDHYGNIRNFENEFLGNG